MSYNLIVVGDLDLVALSRLASRFAMLEVFPIDDERLGIAVPRTHANRTATRELAQLLDALGDAPEVHDLMTGERIATRADRDALAERIAG